ncbi:UPF0051 protein slr0074 [Durusdinium trenchii]|uniref:UPF0051 protein slr0074 n=1 Tax=Durusdinium trenchii TaxID=1381693 RepID=A0ABP0S822_9DINO
MFLPARSAVFSDGSFCYIPKGTTCPMEISTYFRINNKDLNSQKSKKNIFKSGLQWWSFMLQRVFEAVEEQEEEHAEEAEAEAAVHSPLHQEEVIPFPEEISQISRDSPDHRLDVQRFPWSSPHSPVRRGKGSASAPCLQRGGLPPIASSRRQPDWKPVRRKPLPRQSFLNALINTDQSGTGEQWAPPKIQGGGAWGGMLQAQHKRLAGVLAKQHREVSKLKNQLTALQQLNRMGGQVGQDPQTDGTVHDYMSKIAPKVGRKAPQWRPSNLPQSSLPSFLSQDQDAISELSEEKAESPVAVQHLQGQEDSEKLPAMLTPRPDVEAQKAQEAESREDPCADLIDEFSIQDTAEVFCSQSMNQDSSEVEAETIENDGLEVAPDSADPDLDHVEMHCQLSPGEVGLDCMAKEDESNGEAEEAEDDVADEAIEANRGSSFFFQGPAQESLMHAALGYSQASNLAASFAEEPAEPAEPEPADTETDEGIAQEAMSASWMKEFEAASVCPARGRATAEVLMANLTELEHRRSVSLSSSGMCMVSRTGQGDFLGQIGAMEDVEASGCVQGSAVNEAVQVNKLQAEAIESLTKADQQDFIIRGKDWSALAAECDALLESCKRPALETGALHAEADSMPSPQEIDLDL